MKRKRLTSLLLTLAIVITMIPVFGVAAGAASTELNGAKDVSVNSLPEKEQLKSGRQQKPSCQYPSHIVIMWSPRHQRRIAIDQTQGYHSLQAPT